MNRSALISQTGRAGDLGKKLLLSLLLFFFTASASLAQYTGGNNDGFSFGIFCGDDLNGTVSPDITLNAIVGPSTICTNFGSNYSISLSSGFATTYSWSCPVNATINGPFNTFSTSQVTVNEGNNSGIISVVADNGCSTATATSPVTASSCNHTLGGNNDGYSSTIFCGDDLNGIVAPAITINPISGLPQVCTNLGSNYSVDLASGFATTYWWSGPGSGPDSSPVGGYNTFSSSRVTMSIGTSGNVTVVASNGCTSASTFINVVAVACNNTLGNKNDGYAGGAFCGEDLNGIGSPALSLNPISGASTFCFNYGENYSVTTTGGSATSFFWSFPTGGSTPKVFRTFTSSNITANLGTAASGTISVIASNTCHLATASLTVSGIECKTTYGGGNDGFAATLDTTPPPLGVTLINFSGTVTAEGVALNWRTSSELNNRFFTIERSYDGFSFSPLFNVDGAGTSPTPRHYFIADTNPYMGRSYYRLKQTDFNNAANYMKVISVYVPVEDEADFEVYPNPLLGEMMTLKFHPGLWDHPVDFKMIDATGTTILQCSFTIDPEKKIELPRSNFHAGLYFIIISLNERKLVKKVMLP